MGSLWLWGLDRPRLNGYILQVATFFARDKLFAYLVTRLVGRLLVLV
jgi:hypothetical protein